MNVRIAFIHDALPFHGGAERVLEAMLEVYPDSPVFTLVHNARALRGTPLEHADIRVSWLDRFPGVSTNHYRYFPLFPLAVRAFDLGDFDVVIASHYAVATWARVQPDQLVLAYIHTPLRYLWDRDAIGMLPGPIRPGFALIRGALRRWDRRAAGRLNDLAANSHWTARRVLAAWGRTAEVISPPVDLSRFPRSQASRRGFVCVSRLARHKHLDIVIRAFAQLDLPLEVIGEGPELARLRAIAGPRTTFAGRMSDSELSRRLGRARACVHMAAEDFGIALVEAQAAGCPVIAFSGGGNRETVENGTTGLLVDAQTPEALVKAVRNFLDREHTFDQVVLRERAKSFSKEAFKNRFADFVQRAIAAYQKGNAPG